MSEDVKKNWHKDKKMAKEQRRKRQGRQHTAPVEKKVEKEPVTPKESVKPDYVPPGPEFYKGLKRETDEILKITEEANAKYKNKVIQSNWAKYEMPIETYEDIDEQENLGADYEALIQASFSVAGHFQFKHEKSWDITTGPTPFDKYFDINMENLNVALSTIPFYERNCIDISLFSESEIRSMDHRAIKFKQKYYNDKKYTTPDLEAQEKIVNTLRTSDSIETTETIHIDDDDVREDQNQKEFNEIKLEDCESVDIICDNTFIVPEPKNVIGGFDEIKLSHKSDKNEEDINEITKYDENKMHISQEIASTAEDKISIKNKEVGKDFQTLQNDVTVDTEVTKKTNEAKSEFHTNPINIAAKDIELPKAPKDYTVSVPKEPPKNPIIESPEDLEKWLDDFLDD